MPSRAPCRCFSSARTSRGRAYLWPPDVGCPILDRRSIPILPFLYDRSVYSYLCAYIAILIGADQDITSDDLDPTLLYALAFRGRVPTTVLIHRRRALTLSESRGGMDGSDVSRPRLPILILAPDERRNQRIASCIDLFLHCLTL